MKYILTGLALWLPIILLGQVKDLPRLINHKSNTALLKISKTVYDYGYIEYEEGIAFDPKTFFENHREAFELTTDDGLELLRTSQSIDGATTYQYQQYHNGVKVVAGAMNMRVQDGTLVLSNGRFARGLPPSNPVLTDADAVAIALNAVDAETYFWEVPALEQALQEGTGDITSSYFPRPELLYGAYPEEKNPEYRLVYQVSVLCQKPFQTMSVHIDAITGKVLQNFNTISDVTGEAATLYNGVGLEIETTAEGFDFKLLDTTRGYGIHTVKLGGLEILDDDNFWDASSGDGPEDQAALDAHYATEIFYDYFLNEHGVDVATFNQSGIINDKMTNVVHYVGDPGEEKNAFYIRDLFETRYGDNPYFGTNYYLTCPDVVHHEWAHAFMSAHFAVGSFANFQGGAVNEGVADIMAMIVPYYELDITPDWLQADECLSPGQTPRNPIDPNSADQPLNIGDSLFDVNVHRISSIVTRWFYLLVEGGSGMTNYSLELDGATSGGGAPYPYEVSALGMDIPRDILYEAIAERMSGVVVPGLLSFGVFRDYTIQVAKDFYGECSFEAQQVMNAWYAVGNLPLVTVEIDGDPSLLMMEPDEICTTLIDDDSGTFSFESFFKVIAPGEIDCNYGVAEIASGSTVICKSAYAVELRPGFHAKAGSDFRAHIGTCIEATYPKNNGTPTNRNRFADIAEHGVGELQVYPNPSNGVFYVEEECLPESAFGLTLFAIDGREVHRESFPATTGVDLNVNVSALGLSGIFLIFIEDQNGQKANGIIVLE